MRTLSNLELICGCGQACSDLMIDAVTELDAKTLDLKSFEEFAKHRLPDAELLEARGESPLDIVRDMPGRSSLRRNS